MITIAACLIAVFTVPGLEQFRPWKEGDPRPFWNVLQRPFPTAEAAQKEERAREVDEMADEVLAADDPATAEGRDDQGGGGR